MSSISFFNTDAASWWMKDEENVDEEDPSFKGQENERDCTIFVIDCNENMFNQDNTNTDNKMDIDDDDKGPVFNKVCKAIESTLKRKIIKSKEDLVCFILFNVLETQNGIGLANIYILSSPDSPSAKIIKQIRDLPLTYASKFNSLKNNKQCDFRDLLWVIQVTFQEIDHKGTKFGSKRAFIFTNNDEPTYNDATATIAKAQDMLNNGLEIDVFPLADGFRLKPFYGDICTFNLDELSTESQLQSCRLNLVDLENDLRVKEMKKRCLSSCPFTIGPNFKMAVNMYSLYRRCKKESPSWLDARTNQPLTTNTRWICADTGQILDMDTQTKTYHEYGPTKEKIYFNKSEMKEIKTFGDPSLTLMGFKPLDRLKKYYQYKPSQFVYPNEQRCVGSTIAFNALLQAMHQMQQFAVCRYIFRKVSAPQFVALVAQKEVIDPETNKQTAPPGMHMIFLPFADDIRKIDIEGAENFRRCDADEKEDEILIEKSKKIIDKLTLMEPYEPSNPVLQKHYDALEALALEQLNNNNNNNNDNKNGDDDDDGFTDEIKPADEEMIREANDEIDEFLKVIEDKCGAEEIKNQGNKRKRKAVGDGEKKKKKRKVELPADVSDYDWKKLAENDELKSLKVKALKIYLSNNGLKMSGKKADLIERIKDDLGV